MRKSSKTSVISYRHENQIAAGIFTSIGQNDSDKYAIEQAQLGWNESNLNLDPA